MPKSVQDTPAQGTDHAQAPFEEALQKLESIVESMEADDLPLEQLLSNFEQGMKLVEVCQNKLAEAELKIHQLERNAAGETVLKPVSIPVENSEG